MKRKEPPPLKREKMKVSAIQCNDCRDIIYSRARHDFRWCTCKNCAIDGGLDYLRVIGDGYKMKTLVIESTKEELYNDWNNSKDLFGLVSNTDQLNEVENKVHYVTKDYNSFEEDEE